MRALVLALLLVALPAGCGGDDGAPQQQELSGEEIVTRSAEAMEEVETFHFVYDVEGSEGGGSGLDIRHAEGDVSRPDKVQADVNATFSGIGVETELVVVDDRSYLRDPLLGGWREITGVLDAGAVFDPGEGVVSVMREARDVERAGEEQVDGTATYHLTGKVPKSALSPMIGNPSSDELVDADLWVDREEFLVRRIELHGALFEDETEDTERTITASRYGEPVEIEVPET